MATDRLHASAARGMAPCGNRIGRKALATIAASALLASGLPASAFADSSAKALWQEALTESAQPDYSATSSTVDTSAQAAKEAASLPAKYDLRDPNGDGDQSDSVVTPVKNQTPWGTCWAHAAIAASETSILSESKTTYAATGLDLSERHLAWFTYQPTTAAFAGAAQAGEGFTLNEGSNPSTVYDFGGYAGYVSTIFAAGIGPVSESAAPYKNNDGYFVCSVKATDAAKDASPEKETLTQAQIDEKTAQGYTVVKLYYASQKSGSWDFCDWSLPENLRTKQEYRLEESYTLPDLVEFNKYGYPIGTNEESLTAIKKEVTSGRAVAIQYHQESPSEYGTKYINPDTWAQYTYDDDSLAHPDHVVTIVGYDDNYSTDNFLQGEDQTPPANGAFLVKNSYGASTNEFPNKDDWGELDQDGNHTGYFWLSYYDLSIRYPESFNFDLDPATMSEDYDINQYDYLFYSDLFTPSSTKKMSSANEFTAKSDSAVRAMTCKTAKPNTDVTYKLYLLDDDATSPTDGKLAYSTTAHYDYGGFHRSMMDKEDYVAVRRGQRYAVVITQKCLADGKYYQIASRAKIDGSQCTSGTVAAKINRGESWTYVNGNWVDWLDVATAVQWQETTKAIDNFPIKSYSLKRSWASVKQLSKLDKAVTKASKTLKSAVVSKNGKGVAKTKTWITKAQKTKLTAAAKTGKKLLKKAGSYKKQVTTTTPTAAKVKTAIKTINSVKASKGKA